VGDSLSDLEQENRRAWCIIVADDHGPEYVPCIAGAAKTLPVQYCGFGEPTTLLQKALRRARLLAPATQIVVTVREENRPSWEPALWQIRPERRFVSHARATAALAPFAALLSIAADSVSNVVTILPARCLVADERLLCAALNHLQTTLPRIPEGVGTLGMIDIDDGIDEDYLLPGESRMGPGSAVQAMARRPAAWIAQHLRQHGAMVASGILTGYAGFFARHIAKYWPGYLKPLKKVMRIAPSGENSFCANVDRELPRSVPRPLRLWPPTFPQRAIRVHHCGWRGLHTARAVARISASCPPTIGSLSQLQTMRESQSRHDFDLDLALS
jgi:mannose-1-phosphate guanylyltransferase